MKTSLALRLHGDILSLRGICPERQQQDKSPPPPAHEDQTLVVVFAANDAAETDESEKAGQ